MKNLIQYRFRAETIFYHFLNKGMDIELLEQSLKELEQFIRDSENGTKEQRLSFKFRNSPKEANWKPIKIIEPLKWDKANDNDFFHKFFTNKFEKCIGLDVEHELEVYFY